MPFPVLTKDYPLVLASASPRRRELLSQVRIPFTPLPACIHEREIPGDPRHMCRTLAEKKATAVHSQAGSSWILGADTVVVVEGSILGKPRDEAEAEEMLRLLGGAEHRVVTGFCVLDPRGVVAHSEAVSTAVRFKGLKREEIDGYIRTGEPFGKAGAYAIQGVGAFMVESITGSYSNVVGLPICAVIKALARVGALSGFPIPAA